MTDHTGTDGDPLPIGGSMKPPDSAHNGDVGGANNHNKERFVDIPLKDRLIVYLTAGIVAMAAATACVVLRQVNVMEGQLDEMRSSGQQTERLLILNSGQLVTSGRQATASQQQAEAATQAAMLPPPL